jgi:hypothetical protein
LQRMLLLASTGLYGVERIAYLPRFGDLLRR